MNKNPVLNAFLAEAYIIAVVLLIQFGMKATNAPDNIFIPIAMLSLLVLSAALMAYFFLSKPLQLYLDGKKAEAVSFFLKTVTTFAVITILAFIIVAVTAHYLRK